ncbi:MAG: GIY-YIG nuclease family protein [Lacunisphaera sp.]|nr:GIY-YIG nuclease family protein [Lacunisphaera sp.]
MVHYVHMLRGASGRHYIGMTSDLARRIEQHLNGHTHTTKRLGGGLQLVASKAFDTRAEAAAIEKKLKGWKNPAKDQAFLKSDQ